MKPDDVLIEKIIRDGSVELESWPSLLSGFLQRIDEIALHSFPVSSSTSPSSPNDINKSTSLEDKPIASSTTEWDVTQSTNSTAQASSPSALVSDGFERIQSPEIVNTIASIKETLSTTFSKAPPHTVQRFAELLQRPTEHYRSLPKILRAIQRVISVSSTIDLFPLPSAVEPSTTGILNSLGSDESLGGALLTPISWLRNETISTDNDSDTRMNGVSQGGLLRQEQELGLHSSNSASNGDSDDKHQVHAQGPPTLGPEDLGPQPPGVVFPDLDDASPQSVVNLASEIQAKQDEMIDTPMTGGEGTTEAQQSARDNDDKMDVDDASAEEKGVSTEALDHTMSGEETANNKV